MTDMPWLMQALNLLSRGERCVLVTVAQVKGSAPREPGAKMLVWESGMSGSVGGGHLEYRAIVLARRLLAAGESRATIIESFSLGPDLNQCCGGQAGLLFEALDESSQAWLRVWARVAQGHEPCAVVVHRHGDATERSFLRAEDRLDLPRLIEPAVRAVLAGSPAVHIVRAGEDLYVIQPAGVRRDHVLLFGSGHVGKAIVQALAPLPFRITWVDSRQDAFPADAIPNVDKVVVASPPAQVASAPAGTFYLVMTHSHPLDLEICARVLERDDFAYLGLIGSDTKRARFASRLRAIGIPPHRLGRLICPIGIPGIGSKQPAAIAAAVAAQLLIVAERRQAERTTIPAALDVGT